MNTYAPNAAGQIVASQPAPTQPSFNIPFLGKRSYDPNKSIGAVPGGAGVPNNNGIGNLIKNLLSGMRDDKGLFQGGDKGRIFGRARDKGSRYINPILGGFAQSGANMGQDVATGFQSLLQRLGPQTQGPPLPPQGLPTQSGPLGSHVQPTVQDVQALIQQIINGGQ